jgi:hypothetical protein
MAEAADRRLQRAAKAHCIAHLARHDAKDLHKEETFKAFVSGRDEMKGKAEQGATGCGSGLS